MQKHYVGFAKKTCEWMAGTICSCPNIFHQDYNLFRRCEGIFSDLSTYFLGNVLARQSQLCIGHFKWRWEGFLICSGRILLAILTGGVSGLLFLPSLTGCELEIQEHFLFARADCVYARGDTYVYLMPSFQCFSPTMWESCLHPSATMVSVALVV